MPLLYGIGTTEIGQKSEDVIRAPAYGKDIKRRTEVKKSSKVRLSVIGLLRDEWKEHNFRKDFEVPREVKNEEFLMMLEYDDLRIIFDFLMNLK